jgi:hypothetical protein
MIIRNILILTVIAAFVPTAMSNVSASAGAEIALFSEASVDTDSLSITGNGDSAKMELKVTNDNGKSNRISDFQLTADNVLSAEVGDKVTVLDNVDFTKAITTDARNNQKAIGITSNGVIDFAGYIQGVYTLDVVVDDDRAYEAIIAIGDQTNQIVDKEITRVNSEYTIEFVFPPIKDPECKEGEKVIDGKCEPVYCLDVEGSECPPVPDPEPIKCGEGEELFEGRCQLIADTCQGLDPCPYGLGVGGEPEPEPEPIKCGEDEELFEGKCSPISTNDDPTPIGVELPEEEEEEEGFTVEEEEIEESSEEEESGGSDSEGSEESGGSEGETSE